MSKKWLLLGNPNTGKTSVFNRLTGGNRKTGNYPGITVQTGIGTAKLNGESIVLEDLPGTYGLHPHSPDEALVLTRLAGENPDFDGVILVADVHQLDKNLLLLTELLDLDLPVVLLVNMCDEMQRHGISLDTAAIRKAWGVPVVLFSAKDPGCNPQARRELLRALDESQRSERRKFFPSFGLRTPGFDRLRQEFPSTPPYRLWLQYTEAKHFRQKKAGKLPEPPLDETEKQLLRNRLHREVVLRHRAVNDLLRKSYRRARAARIEQTRRIDRILLHPFWGMLIFVLVLGLMFQAVFSWAAAPMDWIDGAVSALHAYIDSHYPPSELRSLLADGILPGIGGVLMFVPQITLLFLFIGLLEETGYMSRMVFLTDRLFRPFGLSGKSMVPLLSGTACAVPAIMSSRTIEHAGQRLLTMLVTPLVTCSARLPVYTVIIALVIPQKSLLGGWINLQGLVLTGLYLLGFVMALLSAMIIKHWIQLRKTPFLVMEMPAYKKPQWRNLAVNLWMHVKAFLFGAGKIILAFSIVLWFLGTHGGKDFRRAKQNGRPAEQLEYSYLGRAGRSLEPVIRPLGYDWKIGIALLSSFAAREIFVSTLSTIYGVENPDNTATLLQRMKDDRNRETGRPVFDLATGISLLLFYAFAMQCFSTLAVLRRETGSWKWPAVVFVYMTALAYAAAWMSYQMLSR